MNDELDMIWREMVVAHVKPLVLRGRTEEIREKLQDNRFSDRD